MTHTRSPPSRTPVDDEKSRLIVGLARIREIGDPVYFGKRPDRPGNFPVWSRRVTNSFPREGVRIPYQEYAKLGRVCDGIMCEPPRGLALPFSYVAEHLSDGQAVSAILALLKSLERVRSDGFVAGDWSATISWCNAILDEVWAERGAYPGIGSVLRYLGCHQGHGFHATVLRDLERKREDPWDYVRAVLEGRVQTLPETYKDGLLAAAKNWRSMPSRQRLIDTLVRFELTTEQVEGVANEDQRELRGIAARADKIIENPYVLCEQDRGDEDSEPIGLESIDQGMWPEGDAALFRTVPAVAHNDNRVFAQRHTRCCVLLQTQETHYSRSKPSCDVSTSIFRVNESASRIAKRSGPAKTELFMTRYFGLKRSPIPKIGGLNQSQGIVRSPLVMMTLKKTSEPGPMTLMRRQQLS
jgi:exodeoxyribonuclease V alpha subunit